MDSDWGKEFLSLVAAVRVVDDLEEAIDHIQRYGSGHSEAIITENYSSSNRFLDEIDAAVVYVNASTRFTDGGQFGLGAEVGISTQKMHARGPMGLKELTGPILIAVPLIGFSTIVAFAGLRPEPAELAKRVEEENPRPEITEQGTRSIAQWIRLPGVYVAVITVALAQAVMIMLMGITALYMRDLGHSLGDISIVFSAHTLGMFAFAPVSGALSDRLGRGPVMIVGSLIIILSGFVAPSSSTVVAIVVGLFLLGLGWSFAFVAGSALLSDQLTRTERSKTQGANDMVVALASGLGSLASGVIYAGIGYWAVGLLGAALMAVGFAFSTWWTLKYRALQPAAAD